MSNNECSEQDGQKTVGVSFAGFNPNHFFEEVIDTLSHLKESQFKVLLYIGRRTLGFHKASDAISLSQFASGIVNKAGKRLDNGCGVRDQHTIIAAVKFLEEEGYIRCVRRTSYVTDYSLVLASVEKPQKIEETSVEEPQKRDLTTVEKPQRENANLCGFVPFTSVVNPQTQYTDYNTSSIKEDIEEVTSATPAPAMVKSSGVPDNVYQFKQRNQEQEALEWNELTTQEQSLLKRWKKANGGRIRYKFETNAARLLINEGIDPSVEELTTMYTWLCGRYPNKTIYLDDVGKNWNQRQVAFASIPRTKSLTEMTNEEYRAEMRRKV